MSILINDMVYDLNGIIYNEKGKYIAVIKNGLGQFVQCHNQFCEVVTTLKTKYVYMLFYQCRKYASVNYISVWQRLSENDRKIIAPIHVSATKSINNSEIDWSVFSLSNNYLKFAILLLRKYNISEPFSTLLSMDEFPEFMYQIVFEENDCQVFYDAPSEFMQAMIRYPDQEKLRQTLIKYSNHDDLFLCAQSTLFSLKMPPEVAFDSICKLDNRSLTLSSSIPQFPFFFFYSLTSNPDRQKVLNILKNKEAASIIFSLNNEELIPFLIPLTDEVFRVVISHSSKDFVTNLLRQAKLLQNGNDTEKDDTNGQ
ncbi:hypothetical protein TRFO_21724 [Tritrichomonas foetus]|uniref:Uncharacterized protein n=1 Tax=Tritrichomonas foetus TaxID=1144522 RepID=A0A1J4KD30_9EUKA|nr:hypothetical protein TRFO_21724 [Tritrichomonas foetus]|eukprot:OHT09335.1 hypothetical protein TRFO_21724 [Tritrichomonas foetus]